MVKLSVCEKILIFAIVLVLLAGTALALILGFMAAKLPVKIQIVKSYIPFTFEEQSQLKTTETTTATTVKENVIIVADPTAETVTNKWINDLPAPEEEFDDCQCPQPPAMPTGCVVPQKEIKIFTTTQKPATTDFIANYPYLVSISEPMYADESGTFQFLCTGVALQSDKILTGICLNHDNYDTVIVRSGSDQWYQGGLEHKVVKQTSQISTGLTICVLGTPLYQNEDPVKLPKDSYKWPAAKLIGWESDPLLPLKENIPTVIEVKYNDLICENGVCTNGRHPCDDRNIGQPLLSRHMLLGLVSGTGCSSFTKHEKHYFKTADMMGPSNKDIIEKLLSRSSRR